MKKIQFNVSNEKSVRRLIENENSKKNSRIDKMECCNDEKDSLFD